MRRTSKEDTMEETKNPTPYSCEEHVHQLNATGICVFCGKDPYAVEDEEELGGRFSDDVF